MPRTRLKPATALHRLGGDGNGPPVVFVHGFGADRYAWAATAPTLFARHPVYAVDLPGHGAAARLPDGTAELDAIAEDVTTALEDGLGQPCVLVGHSLGGAVALAMGSHAAHSVAHIVAIAPAGLGGGIDRTFLDRLPELETVDEARSLLERLVVHPRYIGLPMAQHLLKSLDAPGRREDLRAMAKMLGALDRYAVPDIKTTWLWGAFDAINPLEADNMESHVVSIHVIPDAGHLPQIESAPKVNRIIAGALAGHT